MIGGIEEELVILDYEKISPEVTAPFYKGAAVHQRCGWHPTCASIAPLSLAML
jgi:hypothetical protein